LERWEQRYPANAQAVHRECTVELEKWEQTLHGYPWRPTKGAAPCAVKVACTVLNGGDEETYRKATRLVPTQLECGIFRMAYGELTQSLRVKSSRAGCKDTTEAVFSRTTRVGVTAWAAGYGLERREPYASHPFASMMGSGVA